MKKLELMRSTGGENSEGRAIANDDRDFNLGENAREKNMTQQG
jgi:hypothetical protein